MKKNKFCAHFQNIKKERFLNLLKQKSNLEKCDRDQQIYHEIRICLECGYLGCGKREQNCSLNHYIESKQQKHCLTISTQNFNIKCYKCDIDFDDFLERCLEEDHFGQFRKGETEKMEKFREEFQSAVSSLMKKNSNIQKNQIKILNDNNGWNVNNELHSSAIQIKKNSIKKEKDLSNLVFGLKNLGNTCYFNSVLQCLTATNKLQEFYQRISVDEFIQAEQQQEQKSNIDEDGFITVQNSTKNKMKNKQNSTVLVQNESNNQKDFLDINLAFQQFLLLSRFSKKNVFDPSNLLNSIKKKHPQFKGNNQQDAADMLRCVLDLLSCGQETYFKLKQPELDSRGQGKLKITQIEKIFGTYLCNFLICQKCNYISRTFDFCIDLPLIINQESVKVELQTREPKKTKKKQKLKPPIRQINIQDDEEIIDIQKQSEVNSKRNSIQQVDSQGQKNNQKNICEVSQNDITHNLQALDFQEQTKQKDRDKSKSQEKYKRIESEELKNDIIPYFNKNSDILVQNIEEIDKDTLKNKNLSLDSCLNDFFKMERLSQSHNFFKCGNCSGQKLSTDSAFRKFYLYEPGDILVLVLKRFQAKSKGIYEKNNEFVQFPSKLDITPYVLRREQSMQSFDPEKKFIYDLYGVISHSGQMNQGHYIAYVKKIQNGEEVWCYTSDSQVKVVELDHVLKTQAYLLFYQANKA